MDIILEVLFQALAAWHIVLCDVFHTPVRHDLFQLGSQSSSLSKRCLQQSLFFLSDSVPVSSWGVLPMLCSPSSLVWFFHFSLSDFSAASQFDAMALLEVGDQIVGVFEGQFLFLDRNHDGVPCVLWTTRILDSLGSDA